MKRWYVVQVYTGFEDIVKVDLEKRISDEGMTDLIDQVLIPTSEVAYMFAAEGKDKREKIFPGYLLIHMEMQSDTHRLVSSNPRVTRFLGGLSPAPLSDREVERVFSQVSGKVSAGSDSALFAVGSEVQIMRGPFAGCTGIVDKIDEEKEKLTLMVSIFGRLTPVEHTFDQVKQENNKRSYHV